MTNDSLMPIILCGGSGTRLWPLSRASYPKQYLSLYGESKKTLLQQTQLRLNGLKRLIDPLLICNEDHRFMVAEQMRQINIKPNSIILEPIGRNTAPAICIAALKAKQENDDPLLLVLASDHIIQNNSKFLEVIEEGRTYAEKGKLVTFGIIPTKAETGYGYIQAEKEFESNIIEGLPIRKFIEKPDKESAEKYLKDSHFTWNSGIFLFRASTIINELEKFCPETVQNCKKSLENAKPDLDFLRLEKKIFQTCSSEAIDIAVMEKTDLGTVLPMNVGWSDIGSWNSIWEITNKTPEGNVLKGDVINEASHNCYLHSEHRLIVSL